MQAGTYGEMLLTVMARLCEELGTSLSGAGTVPDLPGPSGPPLTISHDLSAEDERLVASLRGALGKIVVTLDPDPEEAAMTAALAVLDAFESVVGVELLQGKPEQLPKLVPSFVFLLALQVAGQDRAIELAERVSVLIEEAQSAGPGSY